MCAYCAALVAEMKRRGEWGEEGTLERIEEQERREGAFTTTETVVVQLLRCPCRSEILLRSGALLHSNALKLKILWSLLVVAPPVVGFRGGAAYQGVPASEG